MGIQGSGGTKAKPVKTRKEYWREGIFVEQRILDEEERIVKARINTKTLDRYSSVVLPEGVILDNYLANPVVLWNHNPFFVVGQALELTVTPNYIDAVWQFVSSEIKDPLVHDLWVLTRDGILRGYSVGFYPLEVDWENKLYEEQRGPTFTKWDLVEFSLTPIPANPDALAKNSLAQRAWQNIREIDPLTPDYKQIDPQCYAGIDSTCQEGSKNLKPRHYVTVAGKKRQEKAGDVDMEEMIETRAVVRYQNLPLADKGRAWDAAGAQRRVAKWAGYDGSDKDTVNWRKYRKAFVLYDPDNSEEFQGYKLPIADVIGGSLKAVPRGIYAAAVVLQGGRGRLQEFDDGDIEGAKRHISKYYKKMGEVAPWDREEDSWTPEEEEIARELGLLEEPTEEATEDSVELDIKWNWNIGITPNPPSARLYIGEQDHTGTTEGVIKLELPEDFTRLVKEMAILKRAFEDIVAAQEALADKTEAIEEGLEGLIEVVEALANK
jgi:phage head maturation protease